MVYKLLPLLLLFFFNSNVAFACRCPQRSLEQYFTEADIVLTSTAQKKLPSGVILLEGKTSMFKGRFDNIKKIHTPLNSAMCGIDIEPDRPYLLFLSADPDAASSYTITTCNGSRIFSPEIEFTDYRGDEVIKALHTFRVQADLNEIGIGGVAKENSIIGMLRNPPPIVLSYSEPRMTTKGIETSIDELKTREIAYEELALLVFGRVNSFSKILLKNGQNRWVPDSKTNLFIPIEEVLLNRLNYLTEDFNGYLYPDPGAGIPFKIHSEHKEIAVKVEGFEEIANSLWFKIKVYKQDPCSGTGSDNDFGATGYVPAWNTAGNLTLWFWSRGC